MIAHVPDARFEGGEVVMPGISPLLTETPGIIRHAGGEPAADNAAVLGDLLGLDESEQARLAEQGVIAGPPPAKTDPES